jgi:hypothetical protein
MDFRSIFQTWVNVLTKPGVETFEAEGQKPSANLTTALVWIVLATVISALLGLLQARMFSSAMGGMEQALEALPADLRSQMDTLTDSGMLEGFMVGASLASIVVTPVAFLIWVGILHLSASVLGGKGMFGRFAYLNATFGAPLSVVSAVLGFVPGVGGCVAGILFLYQLVLVYFATKAEYRLSDGRAVVVVLAPLLLLILLVGCVLAIVIGVVVSANQS